MLKTELQLSWGCKFKYDPVNRCIAEFPLLLDYSYERLGVVRSERPWGRNRIRSDQFCLLYVLGNWCIQDNGSPLHDDVCRILAVQHIFHGVNSTSIIIRELRQESNAITRKVAGVLMEHKKFFGEKVQVWLDEYARHFISPAPRLRIPR